MNHLIGFGDYPTAHSVDSVKGSITAFKNGGVGYKKYAYRAGGTQRQGMLDATLTDQQLTDKNADGKTWADELHALGFKLVARSYNKNSGNYVNLLVLVINDGKCKKKPTYVWPESA